MPLEDELSGDADGIESSWRHYLALAREAATRSDLLGQEYLNSGIEYETRLESNDLRDEQREQLAQDKAVAAIVELQDSCGTAIDPVRLLKILSTGDDGRDLKLVRDDTDTPPCAEGFQEVLGQCIVDFDHLADKYTNDPIHSDLVRLQACLSDDSAKPFVHLGSTSRPVCLWHEPNDPRTVCKGRDSTHPCPILSYQGGCTNLNVPSSTPAKTVVTVSDTLKFLSTDELPTFHKNGINTELSVCDRIRSLRKTPNPEYFDSIVQSNRFSALKAKELIGSIGFDARYGGYSAVALNGGVRYTTGSPWAGPQAANWPCAPAAVQGCSGPGDGLFCKSYTCSDATDRARANDRLARAVVGLAATVEDSWAYDRSLDVPAIKSFVWPRYLGSYVDKGGGIHNLTLDGETARDFLVTTTPPTPTTLSEYTSVTFTALKGYSAPRAYGPTETPGAQLGYSYFQRPNDAAPWQLLNDGSAVSGGAPLFLAFQNMFPASFSLGQLRSPNGGSASPHWTAARYFYAGLSNDGITNADADYFKWGYYNRKLRGKEGMGPLSAPPPETPETTFSFGYEDPAMLDGLELLCQLGEEPSGCGSPPQVSSVADLPATKKFIECTANQLRNAGAQTVFYNFPMAALDPLNRELTAGSEEAAGGGIGVDVQLLRGALTDLADVPALVSDQLRQLAVAINDVFLAVQNAGLTKELSDVQLQSQISNQIAGCVAAAAPSLGTGSGTGTSLDPAGRLTGTSTSQSFSVGWNPGSIATCANSIAQIYFATEINSLVRQQADLGVDFKLNDFDGRFSTIATTMSSYAMRLSKATSDISAQLLKVEQQRNRARLTLAKALYSQSFTSGFQARVNALQSARFQTARGRYQRARTTAQRMALLAKRAIEMRLGMRLSELTDDLPLVDAPAKWESTVCTLSGLNYDAIAGGEANAQNFAEEFIGDYVDRLENVVESYRLVHNFHEGTDVAVLSLRDDVQNVRRVCDVPVNNELFNAGQLDVPSTAAPDSSTAPGWDRYGCATSNVGGVDVALPNCIGLFQEQSTSPSFGVSELASASPYTLQFGDNADCIPADCGYRSGAFLGQEVDVSPGIYRASVYVKDRSLYSDVGLEVAIDGTKIAGLTQQTQTQALTWPRVFVVFTVTKVGKLSFRLSRPTLSSTGNPLATAITLAAPMLERLPLATAEIGVNPASFMNTSDVRTRPLPVCEDTHGEVFRSRSWTRGSALLCENGFTGNCDGSTATPYGYWETVFNINQRDIETGTILGNSGFARGNFNYRLESVATNFVGTGIKDCSQAPLPSTCHSAGYVPYTLVHNGPYYVRNHLGKDFEAELFTGRIEGARGLATERYITSPLSTADRELLTDFTRLELQGRPLDGNFVLRVWDSPGASFENIEDVQLILKYRYWTRFE